MARKNSRIEKETEKEDINSKENKKSKPKRKVWKTILKTILIILIVLILTVIGYFLVKLKIAGGDAKKATVSMLQDVANTVVKEDPVYVLLMGYSVDQGNDLTDTIILLGYNPQTQKAFMVSVPRDTFVGTSLSKANSYDKINAIYSNKGANEAVNKVEEITGVNIDYYVAINTEALIETVDILGGVEFDVPIDMNYDDKSQNLHIHLSKGLQTLDGEQAEGLLRFRHNNNGSSYSTEYGDNDYGRMHTQRDFIMAVAEQTLAANDMSKLKEIVETVFDNLETDCPMSVIISYLAYVYDFDMDNLETAQVPGTSILANDMWVFQYDEDETEELMQGILAHFNSKTSNSELDAEESNQTNESNTSNTTSSKLSNNDNLVGQN